MTSLYESESAYLSDQIYPYMHIHASGDFNGDGLLDFIGSFNEFGTDEDFEIAIWSQSPITGLMTDVTSDWIIGDIPRTTHGRTVEIADFNGDGLDDVFLGDTGRDTPPDFPGALNVLLLSQNGKLVDASSTLPQVSDFTHGSASGDIDGDGDIDIFVGNFTTEDLSSSVPYFLVNDGNGVFTQNTSFSLDPLLADGSTAELADFDGDGHTDLIIGSHNSSPNQLYLGDGSGNYHSGSFKNLPVQLLGGVPGNAVWMHSFDLENDGDLDIAISYYGLPKDPLDPNSYSNRAIQVLENIDGGEFRDITERFPLAVLDGHTPSQWFVKVSSKDLNGDGYEDLYVSNLNTGGRAAFEDTPVAWISNQEGGYTVLTQEYFSNQFGNSGYPGPFEFVGSGNDIFSIGYRAEFLRNTIDFAEVVAPRLGQSFYSTPGDDQINGGANIDIVFYTGNQNSYTLTLSADSTILTDRRPGQNGTDTLSDIEFLSFDTGIRSGDFDLSLFGGAAGLAETDMLNVVELYIAYFNRAPDAMGLNYWGTEFSKGYTLPEMAESFFVQSETRSTYEAALDADGNLTDVPAFVAAVYTNVLGRTADQNGFDYWVNELQSNPDITAGIFILAIINGAKHPSNPTPQSRIDQQYLETKADVGAYFAVIKGMSDVESAKDVMMLYDGSQGGVDAAINATDSLHEDALEATTGEFLMPLIGVIDDPFAMV